MAFKNSSRTNAQGSNFLDIGHDLNVNQIFQTNNINAGVAPQPEPNLSHKHMPSCSPLFTGRKDYLDRLDQYFGRETDQLQHRKRFVLYGLGGTGKSQICLKFVERSAER
jgi:hypothetical protein